jgi:hypothetical protein
MNTKKIEFKEKMEANVTRAQADLARFRARGMAFTAESKDRHDEHVAELERKLDATNAGLRDLDEAEEHVWYSLKGGVEHTWGALQSALQDAIENFKTEPPVAGLHGSDDIPYPYGEGLKGRSTQIVKLKGA